MVNIPLPNESAIPKDESTPIEALITRYMTPTIPLTEVPLLQYSFALRARQLPDAEKLFSEGCLTRCLDFIQANHPNKEICWTGCLLLGFSLEHTEVGSLLVDRFPFLAEMISQLILSHQNDPLCLIATCASLTFLLCYEVPRTETPKMPHFNDVVQTIVRSYTEFSNDPAVLSTLSLVTLNLCMIEPMITYLFSIGIVPKLVDLLQRHPTNPDITNHVCRALGNLSMEDDALAQMNDLQAPLHIVEVLKANLNNPELVSACLRGLRSNSMTDNMGLTNMGMIDILLDLLDRFRVEGKHLVHLIVRSLLKLINDLRQVKALFDHRFTSRRPISPPEDDDDLPTSTAAPARPAPPAAAAGSNTAGSGAGGSGRAAAAAVGGDYISENDFPTVLSSIFILYADEDVLVTEATRLACVVLQMLAECFAADVQHPPPVPSPITEVDAGQYLVKMAEGGLVACLVDAIHEHGAEQRTLLILACSALNHLAAIEELQDIIRQHASKVLPVALYLRSRVREREEFIQSLVEAGKNPEAEPIPDEAEFDETDDGTDEGYLALVRLVGRCFGFDLTEMDEGAALEGMKGLVSVGGDDDDEGDGEGEEAEAEEKGDE